MLELSAPRPLWQGAAHDGMLVRKDGSREPVTALVGPRTGSPDALARARKLARVPLTLRHEGVVRLIDVVELKGRIAWCYERVEAIGVGHLVRREDANALSARSAAELVAQVAEVLLALGGPGLHHPGPEPSDLLLSMDGQVRILGFCGPFPQDPSMRPPQPEAVEPGAVYRLGVLLASLLGGHTPSPATDASAHEVLVRRALIRAMSRPGPVLSDRYGQWIRHMLAWAPAERPPLSAVPAGLRSVGWATGGQGLAEWAQSVVPELSAGITSRRGEDGGSLPLLDDTSDPGNLRAIAQSGPPPPRRLREPERLTTSTPVEGVPTSERERVEDDVTQEASWDPEAGVMVSRSRRSRPDTIPVDIGPPPEAMKKRPPTLPPGFLGGEKDDDTPDTYEDSTGVAPAAPVESRFLDPRIAGVWVGGTVGLLILALLLLAYLLWGGDRSGSGGPPSLRDHIAPDEVGTEVRPDPGAAITAPESFAGDTDAAAADTDPPAQGTSEGRALRADEVSVLFRLSGGLRGTLFVVCDSGPSGRGRGDIRLTLPKGDHCEIGARAPDGRMLRHGVDVEDFMTVDCFRDWKADCVY